MRRRNLLGGAMASLLSSFMEGQVAERPISTGAASTQPGVRPEDLVIVYSSKSSPEAAAAAELQRFIATMTGNTPRSIDEAGSAEHSGDKVSMLVGRTRASWKPGSERGEQREHEGFRREASLTTEADNVNDFTAKEILGRGRKG